MRFTKVAILAAMAAAVCSTSAAAQEVPAAQVLAAARPVLSAPIDHRLVVSPAEQRATLRAHGVADRAGDWNFFGAVEWMSWGLLGGMAVGMVVGALTAPDDLMGIASIFGGMIYGGWREGVPGFSCTPSPISDLTDCRPGAYVSSRRESSHR
jgi:hypothetical protein